MNTVEIEVFGTTQPHLSHVSVEDHYDNDMFHLDTADVERAREEGVEQLLELVLQNATSRAWDIVRAARTNGSPVYLNGELIDHELLAPKGTVAP